jgi:hypothetical protein
VRGKFVVRRVREVGLQARSIVEFDDCDEGRCIRRVLFVPRAVGHASAETDRSNRGNHGHRLTERVGDSTTRGSRQVGARLEENQVPEHGQRYQPRAK